MKKTKIIASIGPSSNEVSVFKKMILSGVDVARINFSHATSEEREKAIDTIIKAREELNKNIAINVNASIKKDGLFPNIISSFANNFGYSWNLFYGPLSTYGIIFFNLWL